MRAMTSIAFHPVHTLVAEIAARRLSPVDLVDEHLARIERLEPRLQAFVSVNAANAKLAAEAADRAIRAGHAVGPLHGIPIAIKDLVEIEGEVAMGGTAAWRNRVAPHTATLVRKLMAAGMISLGKTHTVEFAYGGWGTNQHLGTPRIPGMTTCIVRPVALPRAPASRSRRAWRPGRSARTPVDQCASPPHGTASPD
jgi:aspartyl-tRNA(Asn)/glutamyl-tRNA(Gln) amidotransferase subunit A